MEGDRTSGDGAHRQVKGPRDGYERIVTSLQEAALGDARWTEMDRRISELVGTKGSALAVAEGRSQADAQVFLARFCLRGQRREDWERRYMEEYWPDDERVPRAFRLDHGHLVSTGDLYTDGEKQTSRTFNEALPETEAKNGLHVRLEGGDGLHVLWGLCDSTEPDGWGSGQIRLIERLQPHLGEYAIVRHTLAEAEIPGKSLMGLLESTRLGVIHLDRSGRIATANDRALRILRDGDGLVDRGGFLRTRLPTENAELSRLLERALPPFGVRGSAGSMMVARSSSSPAAPKLALHITPVGDEYPHFRTRRIGALGLVVDPTSRARIDPSHVAAALGLTPAESQLAVALAAGDTLHDIARTTGRTEETVRWHLKQIFRKQGISRQVDLVRRVLSLEGFFNLPR